MKANRCKTYGCEVDLYRNGTIFRAPCDRLYYRNTEGVYLVGAKNPKEARKLLQKAIKFGSITVPKCQYIPDDAPRLKHGEIVKIGQKSIQSEKGTKYVTTYDTNFSNATDATELKQEE